ncbi:MAG: hypothetical protein WBF54_15410 [Terriglobales bacterium]
MSSIHSAFRAKGVSREAAQAARDNRIVELERQVKALDALRTDVSELKAIIQGIADRDTNSGVYVQWLRERAAARGEKK